MNVSLTPYSYQYNNSFSARNKTPKAKEDLWLGEAEKKQYEVRAKKLKTALGIATSILVGVNIIYFAVKHRVAVNKEDIYKVNKAVDLRDLANLAKPAVKPRGF